MIKTNNQKNIPISISTKNSLYKISSIIIGKTMNDALNIYTLIRSIIINNEYLPITNDLDPDRINVEIDNGKIIRIIGYF